MKSKHTAKPVVMFKPSKARTGLAVDLMAREQRKADQHMRDLAAELRQNLHHKDNQS